MTGKRKGVLICLSGIDGCGKSTQIARLKEFYLNQQQPVAQVWSRVGYTAGMEALKKSLRWLLGRRLPPSGRSERRAALLKMGPIQRWWIAVSLIDIFALYAIVLRWRRLRGEVVLCDRYLWDSLIDLHMAFPNCPVESHPLWRLLAKCAAYPDLAVFFRIPLEDSERRSLAKGDPFPDAPADRARRFRWYETMCGRGVWRSVDGTEPPEKITQKLISMVESPRLAQQTQ